MEGYSVPIAVNGHAANIEVRPDHTAITFSHPGFRFGRLCFGHGDAGAGMPRTGPVVMFQIDAMHPRILSSGLRLRCDGCGRGE